MTKSVVQGYVYVVTAETTTTVTDAHGLNLTVQAGQQAQLVASGDTVELTGSATLTQLRTANFNQPAAQGGGGQAPTPEPLPASGALKHQHIYQATATDGLDLSALSVEEYGTCELWLDYVSGSVTWPAALWWVEGDAPTLEAGKSYAIAIRNDGVKLRANVQYEDTTPAQS